MDVDTLSKKPASGSQPLVKQEPGEDTAIADAATAADAGRVTPKRARKATVHPDMVDYPSDNDHEVVDGLVETSASEFVPDESFETGVAVKAEEQQ